MYNPHSIKINMSESDGEGHCFVEIEIHLSEPQIHKIMKGKPVQISAGNIHHKTHKLKVYPHKAKKIHAARKAHRGTRLQLSRKEIEASGVFDWLKNAAKFVKDKVIDSDFYQKNLKSLAKNAVNTGIDTFIPNPIARDLAHKAADVVGQKTGAFGISQPSLHNSRKGGKKEKAKHPKSKSLLPEREDMSKFIEESLAMPTIGQPGFTAYYHNNSFGSGIPVHHYHHHYTHGGSFKLA